MKRITTLINLIPNKILLKITSGLLLVYLGISLYLCYLLLLFTGIETILRILLFIVLILLFFFFIFSGLKILLENKKIRYIIYVISLILVGLLQLIAAYNINKIYSSIDSISRQNITYTTSLITLEESPINDLKDLKELKIAIIDDQDSIDGYVISKEIIDDNKLDEDNIIIEYENFVAMVNDLYDKEIDAVFVPSNYSTMFSSIERFTNIAEETKVIFSKSKTIARENRESQRIEKALTEPFTILVMGVDSTAEDISSGSAFNGDALMLVTFNPSTLNSTILSIPRDTYVPIMCFRNQISNKITHAAWYGESCMIDTIENFTGIDVDYYIKVNFKGLVNLVDALGGIEVDVPITFCEQDSNRRWGEHTLYIKQGLQVLDGEQALALTRHRTDSSRCGDYYVKNYMNDFKRGLHQQLVLGAILNKAKEINSTSKIYSLLDVVEKNIDTNLGVNQILSFYNIAKDIIDYNKIINNDEILSMQRLYLSGYDLTIYDDNMRLPLYNFVYYKDSLKDIVEAMEINLGLKEPEFIRTFTFSINNPYEQVMIGQGPYYGESRLTVLPSFIRNSKQYALNWSANNNINIDFEIIDSTDPKYSQDQIIKQSVPPYTLMNNINRNAAITLTIINKPANPAPTPSVKINCTLPDNENDPICLIPDFVDESLKKIDSWLNSIVYNFIVTKTPTVTNDSLKNNIIFQQSASPGTKVTEIGAELVIKYYILEEKEKESETEE